MRWTGRSPPRWKVPAVDAEIAFMICSDECVGWACGEAKELFSHVGGLAAYQEARGESESCAKTSLRGYWLLHKDVLASSLRDSSTNLLNPFPHAEARG